MKKLRRIQIGNPILRLKAKRLTSAKIKSKKIQRLIADMFYTMRDIGVGLAAPQVGYSLQLAVIAITPKPWRKDVAAFPKTVIINPKIVEYAKQKQQSFEGCLSLSQPNGKYPAVMGVVARSKWIRVAYVNEKGERIERRLSGLPARVFQHEIDHLNGLLFLDRMEDMKQLYEFGEFKKRATKKS